MNFTQKLKHDIISLTWGRFGFDRYVEIKIASRGYS